MYAHLIEKIIQDFDLYLTRYNGKFVGCCPCHNGADNIQAFNIDVNKGAWFCNTKHCEQIYGQGFKGFVRGLLSGGGEPCEWYDVYDYLENNNFEIPDREDYVPEQRVSVELNLPLSYLDQYDLGNCAYFLNRGFTRETLKKFSVFTGTNPKTKLYNMCIVPVFDVNYTKVVAVSAREPWNECIVCGGYHNPQELCQDQKTINFKSKWRHEPKGFMKGNYLYNLNNSWRYIKQTQDIIIVESPSNCWRLDQAGFHNSVALLGAGGEHPLSQIQQALINKLGPKRIFVLGDNDDAGYKMMGSISEMYKKARPIELNGYNDVAEMPDGQVKELMWRNIL